MKHSLMSHVVFYCLEILIGQIICETDLHVRWGRRVLDDNSLTILPDDSILRANFCDIGNAETGACGINVPRGILIKKKTKHGRFLSRTFTDILSYGSSAMKTAFHWILECEPLVRPYTVN